jgi:hypothetical protein
MLLISWLTLLWLVIFEFCLLYLLVKCKVKGYGVLLSELISLLALTIYKLIYRCLEMSLYSSIVSLFPNLTSFISLISFSTYSIRLKLEFLAFCSSSLNSVKLFSVSDEITFLLLLISRELYI